MLYKGVLISQASGKIGDAVASHTRGREYLRSIGNPNPNPPTDQQDALKLAFTSCMDNWSLMSSDQRSEWSDFAALIQRPNRIGEKFSRTGRDEFVRVTALRYLSNILMGTAFDPPADPPDLTSYVAWGTLPTAEFDSHGQVVITWDDTAPWADDTNNAMMVWYSRPIPPTRNFYKSPFTLGASLVGGSGTSNPFEMPITTVPDTGSRVRLRIRIITKDHNISEPYHLDVLNTF